MRKGYDGANLLPPGIYTPEPDAVGTWELFEAYNQGQMVRDGLLYALIPAFNNIVDAIDKYAETLKNLPDEKTEARKRSREDVAKKRKELRRRGK